MIRNVQPELRLGHVQADRTHNSWEQRHLRFASINFFDQLEKIRELQKSCTFETKKHQSISLVIFLPAGKIIQLFGSEFFGDSMRSEDLSSPVRYKE